MVQQPRYGPQRESKSAGVVSWANAGAPVRSAIAIARFKMIFMVSPQNI
jgi:hypothetical protein